jgi:hypothetical protein
MTIINIFINFINKLLSIEILDVSILTWLKTFTILIITFRILYEMGGITEVINKIRSIGGNKK